MSEIFCAWPLLIRLVAWLYQQTSRKSHCICWPNYQSFNIDNDKETNKMGSIELCDDCIAQRRRPTQIPIEFGGILLVSVPVLLCEHTTKVNQTFINQPIMLWCCCCCCCCRHCLWAELLITVLKMETSNFLDIVTCIPNRWSSNFIWIRK